MQTFQQFFVESYNELLGEIDPEFENGKLATEPMIATYWVIDIFGCRDKVFIRNNMKVLHVDGKSSEKLNPKITMYVDNKNRLHNTKGPAFTRLDDNNKVIYSIYAIHGELHRLDGPAYYIDRDYNTFYPGERKDYYINGKKYTEKEFNSIVKNVDKENISNVLDLGGLF